MTMPSRDPRIRGAQYSDALVRSDEVSELVPVNSVLEGRQAKFEDARRHVADVLAGALNSSDQVKKTWVQDGVRGPLGGTSVQVTGIIDVAGDLMPFVVSVYSDQQIDRKVVEKLEVSRRDREVNDRLSELLDL